MIEDSLEESFIYKGEYNGFRKQLRRPNGLCDGVIALLFNQVHVIFGS